jgi:MoaA/NifB/PqqE/SkfB family radical SAM enzyme
VDKKTYCAYPFNSFFLCANGDIKFCCSSRQSLGNINEQEIEEIMHSPLATDVRKKILNNEWHIDNCGLCYEQETQYSGVSERLSGEQDSYWETLRGVNSEEYYKLQRFDLRWSNTCQLACNYCFDYFSSRWANINGVKINANKQTSEQRVLDYIGERKSNIIHINLLGGEPLLQKQNKLVFDLLPEANYYILTNLSVNLQTNLNAQQLLRMPNVSWGVSFEAIGERFEYVRDGAKWDVFSSNIKYVKEQTGNNLNAHSLWCVYNALNLMEFCDYVADSGIFNGIYWQAMSSHPALSVFSQTDEFKQLALEELNRCIEKYADVPCIKTDLLVSIRDQLVKNLETGEDITGDLSVDTFYEWVADLEKKLPKQKNMEELWPEIYELYKK